MVPELSPSRWTNETDGWTESFQRRSSRKAVSIFRTKTKMQCSRRLERTDNILLQPTCLVEINSRREIDSRSSELRFGTSVASPDTSEIADRCQTGFQASRTNDPPPNNRLCQSTIGRFPVRLFDISQRSLMNNPRRCRGGAISR